MLHGREFLVDVIVPVYNIEKYVDECIHSILEQTYKLVNIILVDDGSNDNSGAICDQFATEHKNIKVIHQENRGLVGAWKTGIRESAANWIVFVDGDDWIEERHIEVLVVEQLQSNADIVVGPIKQVKDTASYTLDFEVPIGSYSGDKLMGELYPVMLNTGGFEKRGVPVSRCGKLIKKSLILNNMDYCQDTDTFEEDLCIMFISEMDAKGISLIDGRDAAYCYRMVSNSMLHGYNASMLESVENVYASIYQACIDKDKLCFIPQIRMEFLCAMIRCATNELANPKGFKTVFKNVRNISNNKNVKKVIDECDTRQFPGRFKLVVRVLKKFEKASSKFILALLYVAARIRR